MHPLPNILIVDDVPGNLSLIEMFIDKNEANPILALSGAEALQKTKGVELALAIIDINMPEMDGFELATLLNESRLEDKVSIILITGENADENQIIAGYNAGALDLIFKPVDVKILQTKIKVYLDIFCQKRALLRETETIFELNQIAEILKNNGEKYLGYFENAPNGVLVLDEKGKCLEVNKAACILTGFSEAELLQMSFSDLLPAESIDTGMAHVRNVPKPMALKGDMLYKHKSGTVRWWTVESVRISETRFLSFVIDITHRIELEESFRIHQWELEMQNEELIDARNVADEAAKKFSDLYDFAPIGFFTLSKETVIKQLNLSAAQLLGNERTELLNCNFDFFVSNDSKPVFNDFIKRVFKNKCKETVEVKLDIGKSDYLNVLLVGTTIDYGINCLLNVTDISIQKRAEEIIRADEVRKSAAEARRLAEKKLQDSEQILLQAQKISRIGYYITDIKTENWISSPMLDEIFGIDESFVRNIANWSKLVAPDYREKLVKYFYESIENRRGFEMDYKVIRPKDGREVWVSAIGEFDFDTEGKPLRLLGAIQDITERKRSEEAIAETISELEKSQAIAQLGNWKMHIGSNSIISSKENLRIFGFPAGSTCTYQEILDCILPEYHELLNKSVTDALLSKRQYATEIKINKKDTGELRVIYSVIAFSYDANGKPVSLFGTNRDITLQKQVEEALKQSTDRMELATHAGGIGIWNVDILTDTLIWDDQMFVLYGIDRNNDKFNYESWQSTIHPDDQEKCYNEWQQTFFHNKDYDTEFRVCWPDGSIHMIRAVANIQRDANGKPLGMIGVNWDITKQRQLEEKLKSSEANFREFFESVPDIILVGNELGEVVFANRTAQLQLGFSVGNPGLVQLWDFFPGSAQGESKAIIMASLSRLQNNCNLLIQKSDSTLKPVEAHFWLGKWNGENCIFGLCKDQSEIQASLRKFNKFFYNNPALLAISTNGVFTEVNDKFLLTTEYLEHEVLGKTSEELNLFVNPGKQKKAQFELLDKGTVQNFELQIRTKSGKVLDGLFSAEVIVNHENKSFLTVMLDITTKREVEDKLQKKEQLYQSLIETASEGIVVVQDHKIKYANPKMFSITGYGNDELITTPFIEFVHPEDKEIVAKNHIKRLKGEAVPSRYQLRVFHKDQRVMWIEMSGVKIEWDGQPATMNFLMDITDRKRDEAHRDQQFEYVTALNKIAEIIISDMNPESVLEKANGIIGKVLNLDRALIYHVSIEKNRITSLCEWLKNDNPLIAPTKGSYTSLEMFLNGLTEIWRTHKYLTSYSDEVNEFFNKDNSAKILHDDLKIKSLIWYPFAFDQQGYYLFTLNQIIEHRRWTPEEIRFLDSIAKQVNLALLKLELIEQSRQAEKSLRENESKLLASQRIAHIGSWELDDTTHELWWSDETYRIFGYQPFSVLPTMELFSLSVHPEDRQFLNETIVSCGNLHTSMNLEHRIILQNGEERTVQEQAEIKYNKAGLPVKWVGTIQDITIKKKIEQELKNSFEQLRNLTQHIESVRESERVSISRELHDDLGQSLTAIKIDLNLIKKNVAEKETVVKIDKVSNLVGDTIKTVQRLTSQLRPDIIDDLGLEAALEWYTNEFAQRYGIDLLLNVEAFPEFSSTASLNIFRVVQEALTNIARHSKATRVEIGFAETDNSFILTISDNGIGITEKEKTSRSSFGLQSMKERAISLGGNIEISGKSGTGTVIKLRLPLI